MLRAVPCSASAPEHLSIPDLLRLYETRAGSRPLPVITRYTALKSEERCFIRDVGPPFLILGGLRVSVSSANERIHELRRSR